MPELKCTVQTCTHNKNFYCDLERIIVGGSSAKRSEETCCDSFEERKGDSYSDVNGQASACCCMRMPVHLHRCGNLPCAPRNCRSRFLQNALLNFLLR